MTASPMEFNRMFALCSVVSRLLSGLSLDERSHPRSDAGQRALN